MAEVYRADQELTAGIFRPAALKVIRPEYAESAEFREMFLDEARTACTLAHPNIVHIYEVGESDGLLYMAMELVPGQSLSTVARNLREKGQRLSDEALLAVGIFTCSALEAVHALTVGDSHVNLVHRDVSPHNLLLSPGGSLKLIDFGIAKALTNRNLTSPGVTKGKAGYFSPEQAMGKRLDGRSDLFSVGVTLYKLAFGATPFDQHRTHQSRNQALVHGKWESLRSVCPGLPPGFYGVVDKALQLKPEDRFATARHMREALERVAFESGIHVGHSTLAGYVEPGGSGTAPVASITSEPKPESAKVRGQQPTVRIPTPTHDTKRAEPGWTRGMVSAAVGLVSVGAILAVVLIRLAMSDGSETAEVTANPAPIPIPIPVPMSSTPAPVPLPGPVSSPPVAANSPASTAEPRKPVKTRRVEVLEEPIPPGEGTLRIGAEPEGEVRVAGKHYGTTPLNLPISSGRYRVEIVRPGGKSPQGATMVKVLPDKTVRLKYFFSENRWMVE
jgi:serine/threonine protein kinase